MMIKRRGRKQTIQRASHASAAVAIDDGDSTSGKGPMVNQDLTRRTRTDAFLMELFENKVKSEPIQHRWLSASQGLLPFFVSIRVRQLMFDTSL